MHPHIQRFEVAAKFGGKACWNAEGSAAMAELIKKMADIIDDEIVKRDAIREEGRKMGEAYKKEALRQNAELIKDFMRSQGPPKIFRFVKALYRAHKKGK